MIVAINPMSRSPSNGPDRFEAKKPLVRGAIINGSESKSTLPLGYASYVPAGLYEWIVKLLPRYILIRPIVSAALWRSDGESSASLVG